MARLAALGDAHLGRTHFAHLRDDEGRNLREEDFLRSFDWAVDEILRQEPDGFLWLGDVFDHSRPTYRVFTRVLSGLKRLEDAGLTGAVISGNHDTPRLRGVGSPYAALEEVFPGVTFAWAMQARSVDLAGVRVHAVPQTLGVEELRAELEAAARGVSADATNLLLAHVALTSLPRGDWRDINELELEEAAFDRRFDLVLLGHYHVLQKASKRTWYAGATDSFNFSDRPKGAGPKGIVVLDTDAPSVEHVPNPHERPLLTFGIEAGGLGPSEIVTAVGRHAADVPRGAIARVYLNDVDPASYRQLAAGDFLEAIPSALHVQVQPDFAEAAIAVQGGVEMSTLEAEWGAFVEHQDLAGLDRERVRATGERLLVEARGDSV